MDTKSVVAFFAVGISSVSVGQAVFGNQYEAYMLMPSVAIANGSVTKFIVSPSGNRIAYRQETVPNAQSLLPGARPRQAKWFLYDRSDKSNRQISFQFEPAELRFLSDERTILFTIQGDWSDLRFLNVDSGRTVAAGVDGLQIDYYGDQPYSSYLVGHTKTRPFMLVSPDGVPALVDGVPGVERYGIVGADSNSLIFNLIGQDGKFERVTRGAFDLASMKWSRRNLTRDELGQYEHKIGPSIVLQSGLGFDSARVAMGQLPTAFYSVKDHSSVNFVPKPISRSNEALLRSAKVGTSEGKAILSKDQRLVVYLDGGTLLMREIRPIALDQAEKKAAEDMKAALLAKAAALAEGFKILSSDTDGDFPEPGKWEETMLHYVRSRDLTDGFNYSFGGGKSSQYDTANTALGFFNGPGGRAVIYLDGSTRWIPNP